MRHFLSTGRTMVVDSHFERALAFIQAHDDAGVARIIELAELERDAPERARILPAKVEQVKGTMVVLSCVTEPRVRVPMDERLAWHQVWPLLNGLATAATHLHPHGAFIGPLRRDLLFAFASMGPSFAFPAVQAQVHAWESSAMGATAQMGDFYQTPELRAQTVAADVFFATYFLVELLTAREPFAGRQSAPLDYLLNVRDFAHLVDTELHEALCEKEGLPVVLKAGLYPDPSVRFPTVGELVEAVLDVTMRLPEG